MYFFIVRGFQLTCILYVWLRWICRIFFLNQWDISLRGLFIYFIIIREKSVYVDYTYTLFQSVRYQFTWILLVLYYNQRYISLRGFFMYIIIIREMLFYVISTWLYFNKWDISLHEFYTFFIQIRYNYKHLVNQWIVIVGLFCPTVSRHRLSNT